MTLSDINREQANAVATLTNIDAYVANATPAQLDTATIWFLTEEAEGAFIQFRDCAIAMKLKMHSSKTPREAAEGYITSAINNKENRAS